MIWVGAWLVVALLVAPALTRYITVLTWPERRRLLRNCPWGNSRGYCRTHHSKTHNWFEETGLPRVSLESTGMGALAALAWPVTGPFAYIYWAAGRKPLPLTQDQRDRAIEILERELERV